MLAFGSGSSVDPASRCGDSILVSDMARARLATFAFLTLFALHSGQAWALAVPAKPARGVADPDAVLTADARGMLEQKLVAYAQDTTVRYGVAVFRTLGGESLEDFTMRVGDAWKIGARQENDGVLVSVFVDDHKVRIDVGYGLEAKLPDAICGQIIRERMASRFRADDIAGGIVAALVEIDARATGRPPIAAVAQPITPARTSYVPPGQPAFEREAGEFDLSDYLVIGIFGAAIGGFVLWVIGRGSGGSDGLLDGGASAFGTAAGYTMSSGGSSFGSRSSSSSTDSSSSWDTGSSSGGSFGGGGASGSW